MGARELEEFGHLFGDARFRTIRAHCLAYEGMRKIGFQNLPWTAGDVRHLMNQAVTLEVTPAKLQKWWGTLKWLSIKLGMLNVDEHKQLLEKRKAIQETLVDTQVKPQRKAVVPTRAIVWALEQGRLVQHQLQDGLAGPDLEEAGAPSPGTPVPLTILAHVAPPGLPFCLRDEFPRGDGAQDQATLHVRPEDMLHLHRIVLLPVVLTHHACRG